MKVIFTLNLKRNHSCFDMQTTPCPITNLSKRQACSWFFWFKKMWRISDFFAILFHSIPITPKQPNLSKLVFTCSQDDASKTGEVTISVTSTCGVRSELLSNQLGNLRPADFFVCFCRGSYCWWFRTPARKRTSVQELIYCWWFRNPIPNHLGWC